MHHHIEMETLDWDKQVKGERSILMKFQGFCPIITISEEQFEQFIFNLIFVCSNILTQTD